MYDAVNHNGCCYTTALRHTPHSCQPELHTYLSVSSFVASSEMCAVDARASHIVGTRIIIITRRWKQFSNAVRVRTRLLASFTLLPSHRSLAHVVMLTHTAYMCEYSINRSWGFCAVSDSRILWQILKMNYHASAVDLAEHCLTARFDRQTI